MIADAVARRLRSHGYVVHLRHDGPSAAAAVETEGLHVDVVVLDLGLPGMDGLEVCGKAFSPRELVARVAALLRRVDRAAAMAAGAGPRELVVGDLVVDGAARRVRLTGLSEPAEHHLTRTEFDLLWALARRPGMVVDRATLLVTQVLAHDMTSPLRAMTAAARAMAAGRPRPEVRATSRDEVGELARAFTTMAAELATADSRRRELMANVAHELRTPVAALRAQVENLVDGVRPADGPALTEVLAQVEALGALVEDLLDLARTEAGVAPLELRRVALAPFVQDVVRAVEAARPGPRIAVEIPADAAVPADPHRLRQVIVNLVDNAALVALAIVVVLSALQRLAQYDQAYGWTVLRLVVAAAEVWLGPVLLGCAPAWLTHRTAVLPRALPAAAAVGLLALAVAGPDALVARWDVERFEQTGRIDAQYLSTLSDDALPELARLPEPYRSCALGLHRVGEPDPWYGWNLARTRAAAVAGPLTPPSQPAWPCRS